MQLNYFNLNYNEINGFDWRWKWILINNQDNLNSFIDEAKKFLIIYEIDSIQNKKVNSNILDNKSEDLNKEINQMKEDKKK